MSSPIRIERVAYGQSKDACRLSNGQYELVVEPAKGRVMRYGPVGGPNVLWVNPDDARVNQGGWMNWGGDKAWIDPPEQWPARVGHAWPPPGDPPAAPYQISIVGQSLRLVSPEVEGYGLRIVREISLAETGSIVRTTSTLLPGGRSEMAGLALWEVTQVPMMQDVLARLAPDATGDGLDDRSKEVRPWPAPRREGRVLHFARGPEQVVMKSFADGDALAGVTHGHLLTQRMVTRAQDAGRYRLGQRLQLFATAGLDAAAYIEFEFVCPPVAHGVPTAPPVLTVLWSLQPTTEKKPTVAEFEQAIAAIDAA